MPRYGPDSEAKSGGFNGAYGDRIVKIARYHRIPVAVNDSGELEQPDLDLLFHTLQTDPAITHVAAVHCETTTGMLNPVDRIGEIVKAYNKVYIVDAMSSFGGIPIDMARIQADFLISSANKCIQGVPGFGFIIARRKALESCEGRDRSYRLDLYDQWKTMEEKGGKWRFSAFLNPPHPDYAFKRFYESLKEQGFVIYPGKVTALDTFRIGNIGAVGPEDMRALIQAVSASVYWGMN